MTPVTVGWFEIPVRDMERAIAFYQSVFATQLERHKLDHTDMAWFPWDREGKGAAGTLVAEESAVPSQQGVLIYFSCQDLNTELGRVEGAGGKVLLPKTEISPEFGYFALFQDTEGNRIGLHAQH
jgi:uncharacterized protein